MWVYKLVYIYFVMILFLMPFCGHASGLRIALNLQEQAAEAERKVRQQNGGFVFFYIQPSDREFDNLPEVWSDCSMPSVSQSPVSALSHDLPVNSRRRKSSSTCPPPANDLTLKSVSPRDLILGPTNPLALNSLPPLNQSKSPDSTSTQPDLSIQSNPSTQGSPFPASKNNLQFEQLDNGCCSCLVAVIKKWFQS